MYKSNVLLYDKATESLWSQIKKEAVTGPLTGAKLTPIPSITTTWKRWKRLHPGTLVLSENTGYARNYSESPYKDYYASPAAFFGFSGKRDERLPEKELVFAVELSGVKRAYPFGILKESNGGVIDTLGNTRIRVYFDNDSEEAYATAGGKTKVDGIVTYWFVWSAFHPDTTIYEAVKK